MQQQVEDSERDAIFQRLKSAPENNKCFDCDKKHPKWASVTLGLYLCLDCAGKHREYGPQISFARSLNLDTWNRRYITFMEQGGNAKALEYFKKHGLKAPFDYKNSTIQKYKQDLTKKVDTILAASKSEEEVNKPIFASQAEEEKPQTDFLRVNQSMLTTKSHSDKPKHGEKEEDDPFSNNVIINKEQVKTKGFTVEFNKNKSAFATNKNRIAAKKIDNVDLDALTLNEDVPSYSKAKFEMSESSFGGTNSNTVKEVVTKSNYSTYSSEPNADDKLKKFQGAKAISSDAFREDNKYDPSNAKKFSNATSISSAQYFGEPVTQDDNQGIDYYQAAENVRDIMFNLGEKMKEKAGVIAQKLKTDWN